MISPCSPKINLNFFDDSALVERFSAWKEFAEDHIIVVRNLESGDVLRLPWVTRFSDSYRKMIYARFMRLSEAIGRAPCSVVFGTLTVDPKTRDRVEALREIKGAWHKLHMFLNKRFKARTGKRGIDYVCCVEPQKSGMVHIHFLIFWAKPSDFVDDTISISRWNSKKREYVQVGVSPDLDAAWQRYGFGIINQFEGVRFDAGRLKRVASYLLKYVSKQHADEWFSAAMWALRVRSYSASRLITSFLLRGVRVVRDVVWVFVGVVERVFADSCSDSELIDVLDVVAAERRLSNKLVINKHGT